MRKRLISLLLVVVMLLGMLPTAALAAETTFSDTAGHWAETAITQLAAKDTINGSHGKFRPDANITRGEVATIFDNLMGYQVAAENTFTDLPALKWYTKNMLKANAAGIFIGSDGQIKPEADITRQEFFVTLARLLVLSDSTVPGKFTDQSSIADWAAPKVNALAKSGLLSGVANGDGTFRAAPGSSITRAEVAVMIARAFPGIYNVAGTYTETVTGSAAVAKSGVTLSGTKISADLFIAPGVGDGEVTLDSVNVPNRTFIDGGGANSVIFKGESIFGTIITNKNGQEKPLTLKLEGNTTANKITITQQSAQTNIVVSGGAKVTAIEAANPGTTISGDGKVSAVNITANDVSVSTPNTKVTVAKDVTGVMVGGKEVAGGKTVTTNSKGTGLSTGSSGGNSTNPGPVQPEGTWAVRFETNGGEEIEPIYVVKGLKLDPVPQAKKADSLFLGWYTDAALETQFFASAALTGDLTLYAKYEVMEKKQQQKVDSFALSDVDSDKTFTVSAPNMTADQVRNAITVTNIGAGGTPELVIVPKGDGTFTISAKDGFREGSAVTLHLGDGVNFVEKDADNKDMSPEIRNASFTVEKEEVNNMTLNEDMAQVKIDPAVVMDIVAPVVDAEGDVTTPGSFTVIGDQLEGKTLAEGALFVLYEEVAPKDRIDLNADYSDDTIVYAKIKTVDSDNNPSNGNQVIYDVVEDKEIMEMPESLPLDVSKLSGYEGKTDTTFEITNDELTGYWADYGHIGLDASTTIDEGDTLVLMGVGLEDPDADVTDANVVYGTVTSVNPGDTNTAVAFAITTAEAVVTNKQDFYQKQDVDYSAIVEKANKEEIPAQIEQQALESGFVDEAMNYLLETATQTDGFKAAVAKAGPNMDLGVPGFGEGWQENVSIPAWAAKGFTIKAKITTNGDHFGEGGLMCQLYVEGSVEIPLDQEALFSDKLVIDLKATFEQELNVAVNVDGGIEWSWAAFIPYPSDIYVNTNVDVKDYTAIKVQAKVKTVAGNSVIGGVVEMMKELVDVDISGEIQELLAMTDGDEQMAGTEKLFSMYSAMLETETDYITLVEQEIFDVGNTFYGFLKVGIKADFVISANVNLVIGSSLEYQSGNRYNFWYKLFTGKSGSSTTRLIDEKMNFQFYVMGTIGLKVGVSLEIYVAIAPGGGNKLASIGFAAEAGAYVELYGYFVYQVTSLNQVATSEMAGALYVDFGIYLEISFFARAGEDIAGGLAEYQPTLFDKKWPLLSAGEKINVYDFTYDEIPTAEKYVIKNYTTDYLPDSYWSMKGMDLIAGDLVDLIYPRDRFVYTLSNENFAFDQETGKVTVTVPANTRYMECDLTIKWNGAKLAFSTEDLMRTIHLVWTNLADEEMSLRHNISVVADGKVIWSKVVGEGEEYALPNEAELKKLLEYGKFMYGNKDLKYEASNLAYENEQGTDTLLNADRDRIYTVNVTPRVYELSIKGVQKADGTVNEAFVLTGKFGEPLDLAPLLASGANDATKQGVGEKPYTVYAKTECVEKTPTLPNDVEKITAPVGKPLDAPIDVSFAKQILDETFVYTAQYNDNFVTATFNFVDSRGRALGDPQVVKVKKDSRPEFDYQAYALDMVQDRDYMVKSFDKPLDKLTADQTYRATCVLALPKTNYDIVFGGKSVELDPMNRYLGAYLTLPQPQREGYTFAGWYTDENLTTPFTETNMPNLPEPNTEQEENNVKAQEEEVKTADAAKTAADAALETAADAYNAAVMLANEAKTALDDAIQAVANAGGAENAGDTLNNAATAAQEDYTAKAAEVQRLEAVVEEKQTDATAAAEKKRQEDTTLANAEELLKKAKVKCLRLYAAWTPNVYAVTFAANAPGAVVAGVPKATTVTYGQAYGDAVKRELRRSGYNFLGWSTNPEEDSIVASVATAENHTLYGQWEAKKIISDTFFTNFAKTNNQTGTGDVKVDVPYDKENHPYVLEKAQGADAALTLSDFIVQYKGSNPVYSANRWVWFVEKDENGETVKRNVGPIDSERYDVMVYRAEDDTYQMYKRVVPAGVVINKIDRPADVTVSLPQSVTGQTFSSITVTPATATANDPADAQGSISYCVELFVDENGKTFNGMDEIWSNSETIRFSEAANGHIEFLIMSKKAVEGHVYARLDGGRNYNEKAADGYLTVPIKNEHIKDNAQEQEIAMKLDIKTADEKDANTSDSLYYTMLGHDDQTRFTKADTDPNDFISATFANNHVAVKKDGFGKGALDTFDLKFRDDPWMLGGKIEFFKTMSSLDNQWKCEFIDVTLTIPGNAPIQKKIPINNWIKEGLHVYQFAEPDVFKRTITAAGTFAKWGGEHTIAADSKGKIAYTYDGMITDQYGTYNAYDHNDAPVVKVGTFNQNKEFVATPYAECVTYSNYGLEIDEAKLYARMAAAEISTVTFAVKLDVPAASCANETDEMFTKTITVTRT